MTLNALVFLHFLGINYSEFTWKQDKPIHHMLHWLRDSRNKISTVLCEINYFFIVNEYSGTQNLISTCGFWKGRLNTRLSTILAMQKELLGYRGSYLCGLSVTAVLKMIVFGLFSRVFTQFHKGTTRARPQCWIVMKPVSLCIKVRK